MAGATAATNSAATTSGNVFGDGILRGENRSFSPGSKGVIGGAQIGYNWQMGSLVTGLEADIQGSGIKGSFDKSTLHPNPQFPDIIDGSAHTVNEKLSYFGTVRGRLGAAVTPDLMLYGTGGFAYGQVDNFPTQKCIDNDGPGTSMTFPRKCQQGQGRMGGGSRRRMDVCARLVAKIEYLHVDLGKVAAIGKATPATDVSFLGTSINYTWRTQGKHRPRRRELPLQLMAAFSFG